jgi:23S rRNA pseudouridine2605 synthase
MAEAKNQSNSSTQTKPKSTGAPVDKSRYPKIQAYVGKLGVMSRRHLEDLIREKKVQVNGVVAKIGQRIKAGEDVIVVDGRKIETKKPPQPIYILLYKPVGYVSSASDEQSRKTVVDLVPEIKERLYPVGRLDMDSEGLMILTNDGELTFDLTHPAHEVSKVYKVLLKGIPSTPALGLLQRGVKLKEGFFTPDQMRILGHEQGNTWLELVIHEGKNRLIRRMMRRIGYDVMRLIRIKIGPFDVDMLGGKRYIQLSKEEVQKLLVK